MPTEQTAAIVLALAVLIAAAHVVGQLFGMLRQPKLVGEILAGVLLGPFVLGKVAPAAHDALFGGSAGAGGTTRFALGFVGWLGLLLLMFLSGSEVRRVLATENRRPTAWILGVGTPLPFLAAVLVGLALPQDLLAGPAGRGTAVVLVLAIAVAVRSIPVLSRIFSDLGILHTRFASIVLGAALLEDIALWAVLAIAKAIGQVDTGEVAGTIARHVGITLAFMAVGLFVAPALLRRLHDAPWNVVRAKSPTGYAALILLGYAAAAAALGVQLEFAAFLAGFGLVGGMSGSERSRFAEPLDAIQKVASGLFIPVYFALVGSKLELGEGFSLLMLAAFLVGSSVLVIVFVGLAARLAGFRGIEITNLAVACNARGGPGIVLASVAYEAGIINGEFFTTLVITAIVTSQIAGAWLGHVLRTGKTLLRGDPVPPAPVSVTP
jgi:Kef-type K+ transport system membrane component KefB